MRWKICMKPSASYVDFMMRSIVWQPLQLRRKRFCASVPGMLDIHSALVRCAERFLTFHTIERIMKSTYDADGFMQIFQRMAGYYPGSTPLKPQRLAGTAIRDVQRGGDGRKTAEWLASVNLSPRETWAYPIKTEPPLTGR